MNATPPQGIDRTALLSLLDSAYGSPLPHHQAIADRILALVRPVEGVTLTPDERQAFETADIVLRHYGYRPTADLLSALAARLEAAQ